MSKTEGGQTISYLYDGLDAVQETQGGTVNPILTGLGIDERYARNEASGRAYFLSDALGSTRALTNASGSLIQRYDYTPYGQTSQANTGTSNPYQYTGRERDASGLYYYRARYYSPALGRFSSEDWIGLAGGINLYAYVNGDPLSLIDPLGFAGQPGKKSFPSFKDLWLNYPKAQNGRPAHPSVDRYPNQCAIRLGSAAQRAGMDLSSYPKINRTTDGFPRSAKNFADWLIQNYGRPEVISNQDFEKRENWYRAKGIIYQPGESGQADHIDLFMGGYTGSGYYRGVEVWYWHID
ncbi:T6SS effector amidase Tae4 family protein [Xanthomonas sacchari]|uniref:T6SS effector amidase Tae4 family protein n=1 Tax=Xanthomonas sacchari TaxID=56458 RepID=UPI00224EA946|nr:T6SS effector amidase Tae4 family protein [Xanthomonas sacchari]